MDVNPVEIINIIEQFFPQFTQNSRPNPILFLHQNQHPSGFKKKDGQLGVIRLSFYSRK